MRLTNPIKFNYYNFVKKRNNSIGQYLPLYNSKHFKSDNLDENLQNQTALQRYKQILPCALLSYTGVYQKKFLVTKMQFNPQTLAMRIISLRPRGILRQDFHINNILPWSYRDMMAASKWPQPTLPTFLDDQMIYFNKFLKECLIFENDGIWNQETVANEKLSLEERINEKQWLDRRPIL